MEAPLAFNILCIPHLLKSFLYIGSYLYNCGIADKVQNDTISLPLLDNYFEKEKWILPLQNWSSLLAIEGKAVCQPLSEQCKHSQHQYGEALSQAGQSQR